MAPEALLEKLKVSTTLDARSLPTMFDLPSENPEDPGLPDYFHNLQPMLLKDTFQPEIPSFDAMDMNIYYDPEHTDRYKRPDWFAVLGVTPYYRGELRRSYVVWAERVRPFIAIELISPGTEKEDMGRTLRDIAAPPTKWDVYERILEIPYYIVFNRFSEEVHAFRNEGGRYVSMALSGGLLPVPEIELQLGTWRGVYRDVDSLWLRWFDASGTLIPMAAEREQEVRADLESERAEKERLLALLKNAGIDPDRAG